ncbi:MAG: hypothetical protein Q8O67_17140 [Deltaproteobacteria bacterium]|nr:hypothetical protein [Deltaproteobacteria bacterium]
MTKPTKPDPKRNPKLTDKEDAFTRRLIDAHWAFNDPVGWDAAHETALCGAFTVAVPEAGDRSLAKRKKGPAAGNSRRTCGKLACPACGGTKRKAAIRKAKRHLVDAAGAGTAAVTFPFWMPKPSEAYAPQPVKDPSDPKRWISDPSGYLAGLYWTKAAVLEFVTVLEPFMTDLLWVIEPKWDRARQETAFGGHFTGVPIGTLTPEMEAMWPGTLKQVQEVDDPEAWAEYDLKLFALTGSQKAKGAEHALLEAPQEVLEAVITASRMKTPYAGFAGGWCWPAKPMRKGPKRHQTKKMLARTEERAASNMKGRASLPHTLYAEDIDGNTHHQQPHLGLRGRRSSEEGRCPPSRRQDTVGSTVGASRALRDARCSV